MTPLERFLQDEVAAGSFPGGCALVGSGDEVLAEAASGDASVEPEREPAAVDTVYDLASLTKPLCTGALVAAVGEALPLDAAPGRYLPEWKRTRFEGITLEHLLAHTSGLAAWYPLYVRGEGAAAYRRTLGELDPEARPGERVIYSDLNFLVLGDVLEVVLGAPLDRSFDALVATPAGSPARFRPTAPGSCASTERDDRFERAMTAARGLEYGRFRDLPQHAVDGSIERDDAARERDVVARQRVDRIGDLLLRQPAHLGDHLRELAQIAVEDALGVVGHIHDLVAAIGVCITGVCITGVCITGACIAATAAALAAFGRRHKARLTP